ncbi:MAG: RHS repeat protein [Armatimonadota bacterium]
MKTDAVKQIATAKDILCVKAATGTEYSYKCNSATAAGDMRLNGTNLKYYHFDELGSTLFLTDANGVQTDKYVYNAWGKVVSSSGTTVNPFKYVGRLGYYTHAEAGNTLLLLGTRFYDPDAGVFTQRDAAKDGLSWYSYTSGHSMVAVDPWGLSPYTDTVQLLFPMAYDAVEEFGTAWGEWESGLRTGWSVAGHGAWAVAATTLTGLTIEQTGASVVGMLGVRVAATGADAAIRAAATACNAGQYIYRQNIERATQIDIDKCSENHWAYPGKSDETAWEIYSSNYGLSKQEFLFQKHRCDKLIEKQLNNFAGGYLDEIGIVINAISGIRILL